MNTLNIYLRDFDTIQSQVLIFPSLFVCFLFSPFVCIHTVTYYLYYFRNDDKTAQEYKVTGGSVLHLVLALRGGE